MNRLIDMEEVDVVAVVRAQPLSLSAQGKSRIKQHFRRVGWRFAWLLCFQRLIQGLGYALSLLLPGSRRGLLPAWKIARRHHIPVWQTRDVNAAETIEFLRSCEPELLVSAYFSQILKSEILQVPGLGVLNIHPGWLPAYRGAMAYFWVLHNRSDRGGVSVHWIDEGIDTGELLEQRGFKIAEKATQETVLAMTAVIGSRLLGRVIRRLQQGRSPIGHVRSDDSGEADYYPMPGEEAFASYFEQRRFFRIRDVLGLMVFRGLRR